MILWYFYLSIVIYWFKERGGMSSFKKFVYVMRLEF